MTVSKASRLRRQYVMAVVSVIRTMGAMLVKQASEQLRGDEALEGQLSGLLQAEGRAMTEALAELEEAEAAVDREVHDDRTRLDARDEAVVELGEDVAYAEATLARDVDARTLEGWGLGAGVMRGTPSEQAVRARRIVAQLRANPQEIAPRVGPAYSTEQLAALIEGSAARVEAALEALADDTRETQQARAVRDARQARFERLVYGGALLIEGLCRQAGLPHVAARVRPSVRRMTGRLDEDPLPDGPLNPEGPEAGDAPTE